MKPFVLHPCTQYRANHVLSFAPRKATCWWVHRVVQHGCVVSRTPLNRWIACRAAHRSKVTEHVPAHWEQLMSSMPPGKRRLLQGYIQQLKLINALEQPMAALTDEELAEQTVDFRARLAAGATLDDLMVEAFAVVREASKRVLGMRPHDVQLMGAMALHEGKVAEMQTGEGKTLVAAIAAYLNALPGKGVHVITVNEYLAARDAGWVGKVLRFLGLSVGAMTGTSIGGPLERLTDKEEFMKDVTYTTALALGFSFLNDQLAGHGKALVHVRPLYYAIIDEADYVLIDEAQQPLIMSVPAHDEWDAIQERLRLADQVAMQLMQDDKMMVKEWGVGGEYPEAEVVPRAGVLQGWYESYPEWVDSATGTHHRFFFTYSMQQRIVNMTEHGMKRVKQLLEARGVSLPSSRHTAQQKKGPGALWGEDMPWGMFVLNALKARLVYIKDFDYIVERDANGELVVVIISTATGRRLESSRWDLHPAVEAKEGAPLRPPNTTRAFITYALFFSYYNKVAGMTGTAATEEQELLEAYNLSVVPIPSHRPVKRIDLPLAMFVNRQIKDRYIQELVIQARLKQQPVLLGTSSVQESEMLNETLRNLLPFPINVLNARPDRVASESRVIALAGLPGAITIATSMAGRGTDILLGGNPKVLTQLELEQTLVPSLTDGLYRSMSAGQPHLVTYRSTFGVLLEGLYEQEVFLRARERAEGAVGVFVGEKGVMGKEAAHELIAQVLETCEELRARYIRWARHHNRPGVPPLRPGATQEQLLYDRLASVDAFLREHHADGLGVGWGGGGAGTGGGHVQQGGPGGPAHAAVIQAIESMALHVWVQFDSWCSGKGDDVRAVGGLLAIATSLQDTPRLERQLRGRAGRQGDPGTTLAMFDLSDTLIQQYGGASQLGHLLAQLDNSTGGPVMEPTMEMSVRALQETHAGFWRDARLRNMEIDRADDVYRKHVYTKRRVLLCGTEQQCTEVIYSYIKELIDSMCRRHIDPGTPPTTWNYEALFTELDHLINPQATYPEVASLLDRDSFGDLKCTVLPLPLDASNTQPLVNALMGDDALAQVQVLLKLPVQTGISVRLLSNLTRMQRRLMGEEELDVLPFAGKWATQAALLRDQLAVMCVLAYETRKTMWLNDTSRSSGYLETCDHLQYDYRQFEITQLVGTLDHHWSRFLLVASGLKEGVNVRSFSNLNSMVEYRLDLTVLFDEMLQVVREDAVRQLFMGPVRIPKVFQMLPMFMSMPPTTTSQDGELDAEHKEEASSVEDARG